MRVPARIRDKDRDRDVEICQSFCCFQGLPSSWTSAFTITGAVALVGALVFIAFGSGKQQPWDV